MDREQRLQRLLAQLKRLRGTGPVQPEFYQWVAMARRYLGDFYGDPSPELADFTVATMAQTAPDDAYMHYDGPWGLFERIDRAAAFFALLETEPAASETTSSP